MAFYSSQLCCFFPNRVGRVPLVLRSMANYEDEAAYKKPRVSLPSAARCCPGNCGFQVTWHPTHCCEKCCENHCTHGVKCERKPYTCLDELGIFSRVHRSIPRHSQGGEWWEVWLDVNCEEWYCNPDNDAEFIFPHVNNNSWEKYVWKGETWFFHPPSGRSVRVRRTVLANESA